ncbi:hypothetical protein HPB47_022370, partial [Ixodes persulcatus]
STRRRESRAQANGTLRTIPPPATGKPASEPGPPPSRLPPSPTEGFHSNRLLLAQPTAQVCRAGWVLRTLLLYQAPQLVRDRKYHTRHFRRCMVGTEMVDWLLQVPPTHMRLNSRAQAAGMWQVLLEEGVIKHVTHEHQFKDKYLFYRFREDEEEPTKLPTSDDRLHAEEELQDVLLLLMQLTPDAVLRMILRKPPLERTLDDLDLIYEELLHIKALSHLSNSIKRELYGVMIFESHATSGTILFNQGDEGKSWYIILRGSVNVVIYGKGIVCSLHEGDDFGKLALVNDAPRSATIVTREDNCHFLRVDKEDFNRILRDVEANTVRLKEHGQDVLLLQKIPADARNSNGAHSHYKYMVMAGTPQKMLEHLLETRIDSRTEEAAVIFRVYCADHTYTTLKTAVSATAECIKRNAAEKLSLKDDLVLVEVKSSGERISFKDSEVSVPTGLSINGRIFISPVDHLDALTPLSEQEGPLEGTGALLETLSSHDIAYHMSLYDWYLFSCIHE